MYPDQNRGNMERGYVKLWRAIDQNELLENDNTAFVVFIKLLYRVDRKTGTYTTGRFKLAAICNMNPNTLYSALKRLEASTMIQQQSNKTSTTITICNWWKYQQDVNNTSNERQSTVNTEQEKKENIDTKVSISKAKTPSNDINELFEYWEYVMGFPILGQKQKNRFACSNLIKAHGVEKTKRLVDGVSKASADRFSGIRIADFIQLQQRQNDLIAWGKKTVSNSVAKGAVIR